MMKQEARKWFGDFYRTNKATLSWETDKLNLSQVMRHYKEVKVLKMFSKSWRMRKTARSCEERPRNRSNTLRIIENREGRKEKQSYK